MSARMTWLLALLWGVDAHAQADPFGWATPNSEEQLAQDPTVVPVGNGAVFVPSLADALNEPPYMIVDRAGTIIDAQVGQRVLLPPGSYVVIITSGTPAQGVGIAIEVREGETTLVPVQWGALRIEVTDERRVPHRGAYEIIRADTNEPYGTGFGADTLSGESLPIWLLPPGLYRIVRPGSSSRALKNFATVHVPQSGFVRFRLVTDPTTDEFRGAGVLMPDEFGSPTEEKRGWFTALQIGADGAFSHKANVVGQFNQVQWSADLFADLQASRTWGRNHFAALAQVEEGVSQIRPQAADPLPILKSRDTVWTDLLFTHLVKPQYGPYVRTAAETQAFGTDVLATEDLTVARELTDGTVDTEFVTANDTFHISDAFEPTIIREGAGLNTRFVNRRWFSFNWRVGLGARQNLYGGAFLLDDDASTSEIEYKQVDSFTQQGLESTIVATLRLPGSIVYTTDLELFTDFGTFTQPSLEWRNTLTLRLARSLSLNYLVSFDHLPQVVDAPQLQQSIVLRASWEVL